MDRGRQLEQQDKQDRMSVAVTVTSLLMWYKTGH